MRKFSVIIPVYNSSSVIKNTILSVLEQSYDNFEIIAIDDGSTDDSLSVLNELAKTDDRIIVLSQNNSGPGMARNNGISHATGDYICFLDSDDYIVDFYLEKINNILLDDEYDLIYISMVNEYTDGSVKNLIGVKQFNGFSKEQLIGFQIMGKLPWGPCSKIVKKEIISGCYFSDLDVGEELIYSLDLLLKSDKLYFCEDILYHYVHSDSGQHTKGGIDPWFKVVNNVSEHLKHNDLFQKYNSFISSLAVKALAISFFRISCSYKYQEAKRMMNNKFNEYNSLYNLSNANFNYIDKSISFIYLLGKFRLFWLIFILSKFRK